MQSYPAVLTFGCTHQRFFAALVSSFHLSARWGSSQLCSRNSSGSRNPQVFLKSLRLCWCRRLKHACQDQRSSAMWCSATTTHDVSDDTGRLSWHQTASLTGACSLSHSLEACGQSPVASYSQTVAFQVDFCQCVMHTNCVITLSHKSLLLWKYSPSSDLTTTPFTLVNIQFPLFTSYSTHQRGDGMWTWLLRTQSYITHTRSSCLWVKVTSKGTTLTLAE